jgi:hypothetical protein
MRNLRVEYRSQPLPFLVDGHQELGGGGQALSSLLSLVQGFLPFSMGPWALLCPGM